MINQNKIDFLKSEKEGKRAAYNDKFLVARFWAHNHIHSLSLKHTLCQSFVVYDGRINSDCQILFDLSFMRYSQITYKNIHQNFLTI